MTWYSDGGMLEDSMLGGGDEDDEDLQELISACRNQVEAPAVISQE